MVDLFVVCRSRPGILCCLFLLFVTQGVYIYIYDQNFERRKGILFQDGNTTEGRGGGGGGGGGSNSASYISIFDFRRI